ncbi:nucleoside triphosphate pyrophosphohydrolase [Acinetobacter sp. ANC 4648]|uniref:nucleoside triphosphate pyrophosphohydrolase n=1 Tax=Acinetobacter sp. ANC 4648 TaxID=1977875 RepID=UPI000A350CF7|nr:nucleoside triphosphate pyrophosphohydrolase [Acinetobacter sp. ANC 4648]OTG83961.1 nucleoside triphosphate pyrophosphohydrolase [Acinetobacter sp. ANC 4648]
MDQLLAIMQQLRAECPWDRAQTPESLTEYAIEEAYEVEEAVRSGNVNNVRDELGDLLLQVVFQSQMYSEQGAFDFNDVVEAISQKLIRRHPHVFQKHQFGQLTSEQVAALWKEIKQQERQGEKKSRLDDVKHAPAIIQAEQIQKNAAQVGFDFANAQEAFIKLEEEIDEFKQAMSQQNSDEMLDEFGDCLFSFINVGRKLGLSSEKALLSTIYKFRTRFAYIEEQAQLQNKNIDHMSLDEMNQLWDQAKQILKQQVVYEKSN